MLPDDALIGVLNALQVTVISTELEAPDQTLQRLFRLDSEIPQRLSEPQLSVLRSVLLVHTLRWATRIGQCSDEKFAAAVMDALTVDSRDFHGAYGRVLDALKPLLLADKVEVQRVRLDKRVAAALAYVLEHATHPVPLEAVARATHVSRWHLERLIKKETGATFTAHVRRARLERARRLLQSSDLSVKEVAVHLSYQHASELTRDFKRIFKLSPTQWRNKHR